VVVEARHLTSADVSRRLGVEGGTVRHYAETLRGLGFPMDQDPGTGAYLWTPELVEIAHTAYSMAKATKGLSFREAVELILYAGEAAQHAKAGRSILTLLHQALDLPTRLVEAANDVVAAVADVRGAVGELRWVGRDIRRDVQQVIAGYQETLAEAAIGAVMEVGEVARDAREALRGASAGSWFGPIAFLVVAGAVFVPMLSLPVPAALVASVGLLGVGGYIGWRLAQ
jgi:hypothetical protein